MSTPLAMNILIDGLKAGGYDGLFNHPAECACTLDDLLPCCDEPHGCRAGWRHPDHDQDEILIWDTPPGDPKTAGQQTLPGIHEEESE